ncbi:hypothetical protein EG68_05630 [Paragonimus skrjabini miyazakii]|uniref:Notum n=1 Tax=Paragonimus skrjabini miyazakii TaxID=59628 RepID=A0A8S9YTV9_9TREM|nr:hypothetical protein EG68_05630 [Paragonimus skrjabini miyazakii]
MTHQEIPSCFYDSLSPSKTHEDPSTAWFLCAWPSAVWCRPNYKYLIHTGHSDFSQSSPDEWEADPSVDPWKPPEHPIRAGIDKWEDVFRTRWKSKVSVSEEERETAADSVYMMHQLHHLHLLNDSTTLCNDGTPAGYYYRQSKRGVSRNWLIFLEVDGILSISPVLNPLYHDYNSVFIPYCSSDLWTGKRANRSGDFYFHGSRILQAVIDHLPWERSVSVDRVVFAGSSAGGIGVLMNVDRLSRKLVQRVGYPILVSGIIDSAWFIHIPAYRQSKCKNVFECPTEEGINRGLKFWNARIPKSCRRQQPKGEKWRCYLAPFIYEHIKTPVYIVQSLFDEAQMQMSKVPLLSGGTYEKWTYIQKLGKEVAQSLKRIKGVFAPSCIDHEILTKNNWVHKAIGTTGLVDALLAWDNHLIREWSRRKMILWSIYNPRSLFNLRNQYLSSKSENDYLSSHQPNNVRFTRNSTLLFFSRLVSLLNSQTTITPKSVFNSKAGRSTHAPREVYELYPKTNQASRTEVSSALTMNRKSVQRNPYERRLARLTLELPKYLTTEDYMSFHVIDSCGLGTGSDKRTAYHCTETGLSFGQSRGVPNQIGQMDHLIPQCNPTCGFISNPHRMKLVDVLALYEVNTDLLANILGLTSTELKNMDSEQQMKLLFCTNNRLLKRHIRPHHRRGS